MKGAPEEGGDSPRMVVPPLLFAPGEFRMSEGDPTCRYLRAFLPPMNEAKELVEKTRKELSKIIQPGDEHTSLKWSVGELEKLLEMEGQLARAREHINTVDCHMKGMIGARSAEIEDFLKEEKGVPDSRGKVGKKVQHISKRGKGRTSRGDDSSTAPCPRTAPASSSLDVPHAAPWRAHAREGIAVELVPGVYGFALDKSVCAERARQIASVAPQGQSVLTPSDFPYANRWRPPSRGGK